MTASAHGAGTSLMGAGLEVDVQSGAASVFAGPFEGEDLGMLHAVVSVRACAGDGAGCVHDYCAHTRIGRSQTDSLPGQVERLAEEEFVSVAIWHSESFTTESQRKALNDERHFSACD